MPSTQWNTVRIDGNWLSQWRCGCPRQPKHHTKIASDLFSPSRAKLLAARRAERDNASRRSERQPISKKFWLMLCG